MIVGNYSVLVETDIAKIQRNELTVKGCITYRRKIYKGKGVDRGGQCLSGRFYIKKVLFLSGPGDDGDRDWRIKG